MTFTGGWLDRSTSTVGAATRHGMCMVAALALGWATMAEGRPWIQSIPKTGQTKCYKLERYQHIYSPVIADLDGQVVFRDAEGDAEFLNEVLRNKKGAKPNPLYDPLTGAPSDLVIPCIDPVTGKSTGQDGATQKGYDHAAGLVDTGVGTIFDGNTGLTWEKKSDDGSIHDKDRTYSWEQAFQHVETLNASVFGGHNDWRLPNIRELLTLVSFESFSNDRVPTPAVWPAFQKNCNPGVTVRDPNSSCTHADDVANDGVFQTVVPFGQGLRVPFTYWSSTTGDALCDAWFVDFFTGDVGAHFKDVALDVDPQADPSLPAGPANTEVAFAGHVRVVRGPTPRAGAEDATAIGPEPTHALPAPPRVEKSITRATAKVVGANPAVGAASLAFTLEEEVPVSISIYDASGRMVRRLVVQDRFPAGDHLMPWDGRDELGQPVPAGVYVTRFHLGAMRFARKLVLTR